MLIFFSLSLINLLGRTKEIKQIRRIPNKKVATKCKATNN